MLRSIHASLLTASIAFGAEPPVPIPAGLPYIGGFADGSSLPVFLPDGKIAIATKYGKLAVPISEIVRIELGFRYPEGMEAKILAAIEDLGASDFKLRDTAQKYLESRGEVAMPALRKAAKGSNPESVRRAEEVLVKLQGSLPKDQREAPEYDVIVTENSSIRGTIETNAIKANTKFFGETTLKLADLRTLRNKVLDPDKPATATPGAKYGPGPADQIFFPGGGGIQLK